MHVTRLIPLFRTAARSLSIRAAQWADETTSQTSAPPSVVFVVSTFPVLDDVTRTKGGEIPLGGTVDNNPQTCSVSSDCGECDILRSLLI